MLGIAREGEPNPEPGRGKQQLPPVSANETQCTLHIILNCNEIGKKLEENVFGDLGERHGRGQVQGAEYNSAQVIRTALILHGAQFHSTYRMSVPMHKTNSMLKEWRAPICARSAALLEEEVVACAEVVLPPVPLTALVPIIPRESESGFPVVVGEAASPEEAAEFGNGAAFTGASVEAFPLSLELEEPALGGVNGAV